MEKERWEKQWEKTQGIRMMRREREREEGRKHKEREERRRGKEEKEKT